MAEYDFKAIRGALEKLAHWECPACKADPSVWGGGDVVVLLPVKDRATENGTPLDPSQHSVDMVPVTCDSCGWTQLSPSRR